MLTAMRQSVWGILLLFPFLVAVATAQTKTEARLQQSYGAINSEDVMARLDYFAIELQKQPHAVGYIVSYGPEGEGSGTGTHVLNLSKDYLVNTRGLEPNQVETIYAGRFKDPMDLLTELWIVPMGAMPPQPQRYTSKLKHVSGKFCRRRRI
jgi:hypothetical protein